MDKPLSQCGGDRWIDLPLLHRITPAQQQVGCLGLCIINGKPVTLILHRFSELRCRVCWCLARLGKPVHKAILARISTIKESYQKAKECTAFRCASCFRMAPANALSAPI